MPNEIEKVVDFYKINFFQPKTQHDQNEWKSPLIITKEAYLLIKDDLINNKRIEINDELYNPYTIDTVKKFKVTESVTTILWKQDIRVQNKVKEYMQYEKKDATIERVKNMIKKAKEELNFN